MSTFNRAPLNEEAVQQALVRLDGWTFEKDAIHRTFLFSTFREAMSFMVRVGFEAEALDHHPELTNVYNRVRVSLNTHDADNKVTELDAELARRINHFSWI
jgi:4a-hydroxytetrahydrobiopterin dehydratase